MKDNIERKNSSKAKKIRKVLLLNIDKQLKSDSNKKIDIMINSKKINDINKAYNSEEILLSETTKIYSNYVEMIEKSYPIDIKKAKTSRKIRSIKKNKEQIIKTMNSSFELNNPVIDFIPKKIDLGKRKLTSCLRDAIHNLHNLNVMKSPNFFFENILGENKIKDEILNKSTKLNKKRIVKVIDKILIKLNIDAEDDDIRRNIIKLRKYCFELIKKKKKPKKSPKLKSLSPQRPQKLGKDKTIKRAKLKNKKTLIKTHPSILSLCEFRENSPDNNAKEPEIPTKETSKKLRENLNTNIHYFSYINYLYYKTYKEFDNRKKRKK